MQANITFLDFIILPFLLAIIYAFAYLFRNKYYPIDHSYRKYFIPGLTVKIIGAIFIGLIYEYYYGGGDTFNYFHDAKIINSTFWHSPGEWVNLIFKTQNTNRPEYFHTIDQLYFYDHKSEMVVSSITAVLGLPFFTTYLPTAIVFAVLSFTGIWALFRTFASFYPGLIKPIAVATLFIPSVAVWGSGIFKDTICMFALGWLTYGVFQILVKRKINLFLMLITFISILLISKIKIYILLAFLPALFIWVLTSYTQYIKINSLRSMVRLFAIVFATVATIFVFNKLGQEVLGQYALENVLKQSEVVREYISFASGDEGSKYDLGTINSPQDVFLKAPQAINVTLFRPYLWESRKIIILFSAIESFIFLLLTLKLIFSVSPSKILHTITADPNIQFCLIFTIVFAFAVGISTYNFGSLVRYKIPCLPFYTLALLIIYYKNQPSSKKLFRILGI